MDVFQTTATAVALAVSVTEFIRRYHNAPKEVREVLARIEQNCHALKLIVPTLQRRRELITTKGPNDTNIEEAIGSSVRTCNGILANVKDILVKAETRSRLSLDRAKLVLRRKDLYEMQNDLAAHISLVNLILSLLVLSDGVSTNVAVNDAGNILSRPLSFQIEASQLDLRAIRERSREQVEAAAGALDGVEQESPHNQKLHSGKGPTLLEEWIKRTMSVQANASNGRSTPRDDCSDSQLPSHTPSRPSSPSAVAPSLWEGDHDEKHSEGALERFVFSCERKADDDEERGNLNSAEASLRKAIRYAEQLEKQSNEESSDDRSHDVRSLNEKLATVYSKQSKWQEAISLLSALLARDPLEGNGPGIGVTHLDRIRHNQLLGAIYLAKSCDRVQKDESSSSSDRARAVDYILEAYHSREQYGRVLGLPLEEQDRQLKCLELLIKTYEHCHMPEEARAYQEMLFECSYQSLEPLSRKTTWKSLEDHDVISKAGMDFSTRIKDIHHAIREGDVAVMHSFAPYETVDIEDLGQSESGVLLFAAIKSSDRDLVELILDQRIHKDLIKALDPQEPARHHTVLHVAAEMDGSENLRILHALLRHDAGINARSRQGHTPLAKAVKSNNMDAVKMLLDANASAGIADSDGWSPLHHAVHLPDLSILKLLLARVPSLVTSTDQVKKTPLHHAIKIERLDHIKTILDCEEPFDVNACDSAGHSALYMAASLPVKEHRHQIFELLVKAGAEEDQDNPPPQIEAYRELTEAQNDKVAPADGMGISSAKPIPGSGSSQPRWLRKVVSSKRGT